MGSVCDCCVAAYCSCQGGASSARPGRLDLLIGDSSSAGLLEVDFHKRRGGCNAGQIDCAVHGQCSFCTKPLCQSGKKERSVKRKLARIYSGEDLCPSSSNGQQDEELGHLMEALEAEREAVGLLSMELEEERNAAAIAATETLAMITRLQEEKAVVQMEASQYKRMVEERTEYDQGAIGLLNEMLARQEEDRAALSREVEFYRSSIATGKMKDSSSSSVESGACSSYVKGGERERKNLMESFEKAERGGRYMDVDRDYSASSRDTYDVSSRVTTVSDSGRSDEEFVEKYDGSRRRSCDRTPPSRKVSRFDDSASSFSGLYTSRDEEEVDAAVDRIVRSLARPNGKLTGELRELSHRLRALEAERDYHVMRRGGGSGEMEILEEISQQLRAMDRKPDDSKELSEASFVFSFKGFFSFNGLRQSLNSNLNRLACMFLKHTDATGLSYGDHHVGLSHLLESSSRKTPRAVTRGLKADPPPLLHNSPYIVLHRQNLDWPMDARGRSETAFSGWDY